MLDKLGYYKLVMQAFESLKREIQEAEQFTANEHNSLLDQLKNKETKSKKSTKQEATVEEK